MFGNFGMWNKKELKKLLLTSFVDLYNNNERNYQLLDCN